MKIFVDIDETICFYKNKKHRLGYANAIPDFNSIAKKSFTLNNINEIIYKLVLYFSS